MFLKNKERMQEITKKLAAYSRLEKGIQKRTGNKPSVFSKEKESLKAELSKLRRESGV